MDVDLLGGGPGGLYASLLLKKEFPDWDVTVYERDPVDNTYGWGVVFSDATLSALREADRESHERITDAFARWDPIDVYYDDEYYRCTGHAFAGIMRADLLAILQERARDLGVDLRHETEVSDPSSLAEEADVLVGADGLNSTTREHYADQFRPNVSEGSAKFAWFGTEKPFDVFTFVFRENEHGLWRVHAYPGRKSTFIVECTEDTWRAAGMDEASEDEALAYFEDLFADHLDGYDLLSKLYAWRNFPVVRNGRWSHDNVVLVGDAAHTAHFTIGSGTKMAMEDAIALVDGFAEHGTNVEGAFRWYEKERRPRVEGLQDAATRSQRYFENVERYTHLRPRRFAFNLLTRSGRITYDNLRIRDPEFVDAYDRWFERTEGVQADGDGTAAVGGSTAPAVATPPMFKPFSLGAVTLSNRVVRTHEPTNEATDGRPTDEHLDRLVERGLSGAGMVLTDPVAVTSNGRIMPGTPGLYEDVHGDAWARLPAEVHDRSDAKVGVHLVHAGRRGATRSRERGLDRPLPRDEAWELFAPSATPFAPNGSTPTAMTEDDLARVQDAFVGAAERAADAGFDHLHLHAGHGYLLSSFLSPLSNERDDEYGGALENRMRYPLAVFDAVRESWPDDRSLGVTLQATDWNLNGFKTRESYAVADALKERGCHLVSVVAGQASVRERPSFDPNTLARFADRVRNEVNLPTLATNHVTTYDEVNTLVGSGRADLCTFDPAEEPTRARRERRRQS